MKIAIAIPARLGSTRFPKKVLADLCGKPVIQHVYELAKSAEISDKVYILVDSKEVEDVVKTFCEDVIMTSPDCACGTERIASILGDIDGDFIINIQGDEPLLDPKMLKNICQRAVTSKADIITPIFKITDLDDIDNPSRVKVVVCKDGRALYFSRSAIPFVRGIEKSQWLKHTKFFGHVGVYGYTRKFLQNYMKLHDSALETAEMLEQLRFLDNGYSIDTVVCDRASIGIDTPEDLKQAVEYFQGRTLGPTGFAGNNRDARRDKSLRI